MLLDVALDAYRLGIVADWKGESVCQELVELYEEGLNPVRACFSAAQRGA